MTTAERARAVVATVVDPELPVVTLADLGVLRGVEVDGERVVVTLTPTYSGCPAMDEIRSDVERALHAEGFADVEVRTVLTPAWSTAQMTDAAREALRAYGVAPPSAGPVLVPLRRRVVCPQCGSAETEELTRFGAAPCRALWRCRDCREPFDLFKDL